MKVQSKVDPYTYYTVTEQYIRICRFSDKLTMTYVQIPEQAKRFNPEIQAELMEFWENKFPERPCKVCGNNFRSNRNREVYCSPECRTVGEANYKKVFSQKLVTRQCPWCYGDFTTKARDGRKYCSDKCKSAALSAKRQEAKEQKKEEGQWKSHLNEKMQKAASLGINYAELQKRETLKQVGRVVI